MGVRAELCIFAVACMAYHFLSQGISLPNLASGKLPGKAVGSGAADKTRGRGLKQPVKLDWDRSSDSMECSEVEVACLPLADSEKPEFTCCPVDCKEDEWSR